MKINKFLKKEKCVYCNKKKRKGIYVMDYLYEGKEEIWVFICTKCCKKRDIRLY